VNWNDHYDYAERHHRHYDDESKVSGLSEGLRLAEERINDLDRETGHLQVGHREVMAQVDMLRRELEDQLRNAFERIRDLEGQTPQAQRLQLEADQAAADLAESGYEPDERGVSEYNREVDQLRRDVMFADVVDDDFAEANELRLTALEELLYTRWPRRILVRRRLVRDLRASVARVQGDTFAERRSEAISSGWVKPLRYQR